MSLLENKSVRTVREALAAAGSSAQVINLPRSVRTAEEAACALDASLGALVRSLAFLVGDHLVMALVAGDRQCAAGALPRALNLEGAVRRADIARVRQATGFAAGGLAPVGMPARLPTVIDVSLKRFDTIYAAAGHPHYVFATTVEELKRLTGGIVSYSITEGERHHPERVDAKAV